MFDNNAMSMLDNQQKTNAAYQHGQDGGESVVIWACFIVSIDLQCREGVCI